MTALFIADRHDPFTAILGSKRGNGGVGCYADLLLGIRTGAPLESSLHALRRRADVLTSNGDAKLLFAAVNQRLLASADKRYLNHTRELLHLMGVSAKYSEQQAWVRAQPDATDTLHLTRVRKYAWEPILKTQGLRLLCGALPGAEASVRLAARGSWQQLVAAAEDNNPDCICATCFERASTHYPRDIEEFPNYPLFAWSRSQQWREQVGAECAAHLQTALTGPAANCSSRALSSWLSTNYRTQLVERVHTQAVALHDHPLRRAVGLGRYQLLLDRFGYARGRASKPTLWQDLRASWPALTDEWLRCPPLPSTDEVADRYEQLLAAARS